MLKHRFIAVLLLCCFLSCHKESLHYPYGYLSLRIENQEDSIRWEVITFKWDDSLGNVRLDAFGTAFDQFRLNLDSIFNTGLIDPLTLTKFYYTNGIDLRPFDLSGQLLITQVSSKSITGTFDIHLANNYNGVNGKRVFGYFGVVNQ